MIDPILSLAFSVHSNKGIFALLLGSGVSRAAGIPTGWEVVLDLTRKLAHLQRQDCEPDPAAWYHTTFGEEPDYAKLLDALANSPAERSQLLRNYFEPTEEEREQGLKIPTDAHKAIAELVAGGYLRVIVTTNFDRMLENALESIGVVPTVLSTPDAVEGALPLAHATNRVTTSLTPVRNDADRTGPSGAHTGTWTVRRVPVRQLGQVRHLAQAPEGPTGGRGDHPPSPHPAPAAPWRLRRRSRHARGMGLAPTGG